MTLTLAKILDLGIITNIIYSYLVIYRFRKRGLKLLNGLTVEIPNG